MLTVTSLAGGVGADGVGELLLLQASAVVTVTSVRDSKAVRMRIVQATHVPPWFALFSEKSGGPRHPRFHAMKTLPSDVNDPRAEGFPLPVPVSPAVSCKSIGG